MLETLFIKTNGCQMNEYDSQKMADVLQESHGLRRVNDATQADLVLLNTCSIREKAQEKVFSQLGQWREFKKKHGKPLFIGVGGCVASQEGETILKRAPYVDLIIGPQTIHRLPEMLNKALDSKKPSIDISFPEIEKFDHLPAPRAEGPTAFVSIMEGRRKTLNKSRRRRPTHYAPANLPLNVRACTTTLQVPPCQACHIHP